MSGMSWKSREDEALDRHRRFFNREMQDGILATLPARSDVPPEHWAAFDSKWGKFKEGERRPFPCNEEIFDREMIRLEYRSKAEDDWLPVVYSILDAGESMVGGMFGSPMEFIHRPGGPAVSMAEHFLSDYAMMKDLHFSLENEWTARFLDIQDYFRDHMAGRFAQHPCLTVDALNFACELRGATQSYIDIYEYPEELRHLMEIGLDFNTRFQDAQLERCGTCKGGSFNWLGQWVPFERSVSLSVDAYVICSVENYVEFGFDYQKRLVEHFDNNGFLHFHCNRADLAAEVAKLPLKLFQYGQDSRDTMSSFERLPEMRAAVGDIPIQVEISLAEFQDGLAAGTLPPNVWYQVGWGSLAVDEANRLMEKVRKYRK